MAKTLTTLSYYIDGNWIQSKSENVRPVYDPGSEEEIALVPYATRDEVDATVEAASRAFDRWSRLPFTERVRYLFRMKEALERHFEELAKINTLNHGKTLEEGRGDLRRAIENVDAAIAAAYTVASRRKSSIMPPEFPASTQPLRFQTHPPVLGLLDLRGPTSVPKFLDVLRRA
jgi:malonate-semialdehyde dehydrogenase (acetylating)/methylmalonate-semialdehyde dehydrogenase